MRAALEARGLTFVRGGRPLVAGIDLTVASGRFTVIVGPNGAGKSTLLRLLCGELSPSAGTIDLQGRPLRGLSARTLAHLRAVMPQATDLAFPFRVVEVVSLGVDGIGQGLDRADRAACVADALARADIGHLAARLYQTLSGGERQRVHFARVLAQLRAGRSVEPDQVLFLDEPIASLDLRHGLAVIEEARALVRSGVTVVAVLHDLLLAAEAAESLVLLNKGRVAAQGSAETVLTRDHLADVFGVALATPELPRHPWTLVADPAARAAVR